MDADARLMIMILLGAAMAGATWYFWDDIFPPQDVPALGAPDIPAEPPAEAEPVPRHPITPADESPATTRTLVPLPDLDNSDEYFLLEMANLFGPEIERLLVNEALIDKFVATVDNLPRKQVGERIRPLGQLSGSFIVDAAAENGPFSLSPENYRRYDLLVNTVVRADIDAIVSMYRRFYPLLNQSYVRLGYPNGYFNDRVVEVIDHLLATPQPEEPILLVQPNVLYEYADPELEALSSGQKLMLRMGNDHAARLKTVLRELRANISSTGAAP